MHPRRRWPRVLAAATLGAILLVALIAVDVSRQPSSGRGWLLLAHSGGAAEPADRVGVLADDAALAAAWSELQIADAIPAFDRTRVLVVLFTQIGSGCESRFDGIVFDPEARLVAASFSYLGMPFACSAVGVPYSFIVAIDRDRLPPIPFRIQLTGPPRFVGGVGVDVDH